MQDKGAAMTEATNEVLVLTALPLEFRAMHGLLLEPKRIDHAGTVFACGRLRGTSWTVYLAITGAGNDSAAAITERAVSYFRPQAAFFTGIAGSLKPDVFPNDVVVALEVYAYHGGKEDSEGFKVRPRSWETTHLLQQVAMYADNATDWRAKLPEADRDIKVHFKPIAAGDRVLNSPAGSSPRLFLDQNYNDAVAVDMEGAGFASAAHKAAVPHLLVRGISDMADGTKQTTDGVGMQESAARNAALFLAEVIAQISPASSPSGSNLSSAPLEPVNELIWHPLDRPVEVSWRKDLFPSGPHTSGPSLLEIHLVPVPSTVRVPVSRMRQLANELADLGRSRGFFSNLERLEVHDLADMIAVTVNDRRGRSAGLAITSSGQRSAWEPLPNPGLTYVLDEEHTRERITVLLALLEAVEGPATPSYAPAAAIEKTMLVTVERLSEVNRNSAGLRTSDTPIVAEPEEAVTAAAVASHGTELAEELTARLIYSFRTPRRR
ncbi:5'-methylthioadenosine/S-adenosylhomocysteine nucleosidase [Streptomyces sp. SID8016]|uniref:phosphorylase family protein n=1 Tax=Streptomyces sp. SID8016 TaxID=2706098 RepID=UPI0013DC5369|nr:5'-methylthioadenosine/S-adenosylhomocysteine nucleosidase [Streptomyces sp. SID8016]